MNEQNKSQIIKGKHNFAFLKGLNEGYSGFNQKYSSVSNIEKNNLNLDMIIIR